MRWIGWLALAGCGGLAQEFQDCGCDDKKRQICVVDSDDPQSAVANGTPGSCVDQPQECDNIFDLRKGSTDISVACQLAICPEYSVEFMAVFEEDRGQWYAGCVDLATAE